MKEDDAAKILKLSDLIAGARPVTGASSIAPNHPVSDFDWQRYDHPPPKPPSQNPIPRILKPFTHPSVLIGALTLPVHPDNDNVRSSIECFCFQFGDGSATICCDVLNFHPQIIGRNVRVCAWNFIPLKVECNNIRGFLEIIVWEFVEVSSISLSFPLGLVLGSNSDCKDSSKAKYFLFGVLESVSPVSVVPCSIGGGCSGSGSRNLCGFLVKILVCDCKMCCSRKNVVALRDLSLRNYKDHCFIKSLTVYFCESASSWHPAIVRLIGSVVALSGLKKKLVYIGNDDSELMYVTTEKAALQVPEAVKKYISKEKPKLRGLGEVGSYVGTVTGVYMQGMVVELDQELLLLLTDHQLLVSHSLRLGSIVCVRNVHFVNPKFSWTKTLVLGACFVTCVSVELFSPLEARCHKRSRSQNLLQKFIDSLTFSARLWVLLTVACFRKKFAGILSETEILGSKHKAGFAQMYATSCLPASAYRVRHGVFVEYCKHSSCAYNEKESCSLLKLAVTISCFRNYVENRWMKMFSDRENDFNIIGDVKRRKYISCCGRSYAKLIRNIFQSEGTSLSLLGNIKVSLSSSSLQLVDATGSIDVVIPKMPSTWDSNRVYEVEDFAVVMQGIFDNLDSSELFPHEPFTCKNIFEGASLKREIMLTVYLYHHFKTEKLKACFPSSSKGCESNFQELQGGKFHLLWLKHKFPFQKSPVDQVISNRLSAFAEALILPWVLIVPEKGKLACLTGLLVDELRNMRKYEKQVCLKRCKTSLPSNDMKSETCYSDNSKGSCLCSPCCNCCTGRNHRDMSSKIQCLISSTSFEFCCRGFLCCTDKKAVASSWYKPDGRGTLLEFDSESLCMFQGLRIGAYYLVKDNGNDVLCAEKTNKDVTGGTMFFPSNTHLWSVSFLPDVVLKNSDSFSALPFMSNHDIVPDTFLESEILSHKLNSAGLESCPDVNLCVPFDIISYLKVDTNVSESGLRKSSIKVEDDVDIHNGSRTIFTTPMLAYGTSPFGLPLPEGDLLSVHGHVVAIHYSNCGSFVAHPRNGSSVDVHPSIFSPGSSIICIHVLVDDYMASIVGTLGKNAYPTGFGPGVDATFHRILVCGKNRYLLLSASFIALDFGNVFDNRCLDDSDSVSDSLIPRCATSMGVFPAALISEITSNVNFKPMQLHVRVVGIYVVVLEEKKKAGYSSTKVRSHSPVPDIPLAGFIVDDGSSSCCCWANYERAATILRLPIGVNSSEACTGTSSRSKIPVKGEANGSLVVHLNAILRRHRRVIVRNYGSLLDPSSLDLAVYVESEELMSSFHERLLRGLITSACFSTLWTIVGGLMDSAAVSQLEKQLNKLEMTLLPLKNVWSTGVYRTDPLAESRMIIQDLVKS